MNERDLNPDGSDARWCDECKTELATNECTDALESAEGTWSQSAPRRGCQIHSVQPMIHFADGRVMSFAAYQASMDITQ